MNTYPHRRAVVFPSTKIISCAACNDLLDLYLDAELANLHVQSYYTEVWQHLQTCRSCAAYHDWLYTILRKKPASPFSHTHPNPYDLSFLPFRQPPTTYVPTTPAWRTYLRPQLLGEPFLLRFSFSPEYLQYQLRLLSQDAVGVTCTDEPSLSPWVLLQQHVPLREQELIITIAAYLLSARLGLVRLQAILFLTSSFSAKLQAKLQWGRIARVTPISEIGEADLGLVFLVPAPEWGQPVNHTEEDRFAVTFEAGP